MSNCRLKKAETSYEVSGLAKSGFLLLIHQTEENIVTER